MKRGDLMRKYLIFTILVLFLISIFGGCIKEKEVEKESVSLEDELLKVFEDKEALQESDYLYLTYNEVDVRLEYPEINIYIPPERQGWRLYIFTSPIHQKIHNRDIHFYIDECYYYYPQDLPSIDHITELLPLWAFSKDFDYLAKEKLYFLFCNEDFYLYSKDQDYVIYEVDLRSIIQRYGFALSGWNVEAYVLYHKDHKIEICPEEDIKKLGTKYITYKIDPEHPYRVICTDYEFWNWIEQYKVEENVIKEVNTDLKNIKIEESKIDQMRKALAKADVTAYRLWLEGYLKKGGKITHYYDYPFSRNDDWYIAIQDVTIYPIGRFNIIVSQGVKIHFPEGYTWRRYDGAINFYYIDNYETNSTWIPTYSDIDIEEN